LFGQSNGAFRKSSAELLGGPGELLNISRRPFQKTLERPGAGSIGIPVKGLINQLEARPKLLALHELLNLIQKAHAFAVAKLNLLSGSTRAKGKSINRHDQDISSFQFPKEISRNSSGALASSKVSPEHHCLLSIFH
jgi:hypothetical protein